MKNTPAILAFLTFLPITGHAQGQVTVPSSSLEQAFENTDLQKAGLAYDVNQIGKTKQKRDQDARDWASAHAGPDISKPIDWKGHSTHKRHP